MFDTIMDFVAWAIILNVFASIYVFAVSKLMPHFLFDHDYKKHTIRDRGLKKYTFPEGRSVVYEPDIRYRSFLKKYILFEFNEKKYIKCKLSEDVDSIRYEVALYDNKDRLIKVMEIAENISGNSETKNIELPADTSYASVVLKRVNEGYTFDTLRKISAKRIAIFSAVTAALSVAYGLLVRALLLYIGVVADADPEFTIGLGFNVTSSLIVGVIVILLCVFICRKRIFGDK